MTTMPYNRSVCCLKPASEFAGRSGKPEAELDAALGSFVRAESSELNTLVDHRLGSSSGCLRPGGISARRLVQHRRPASIAK
jgi:hypothetical protein